MKKKKPITKKIVDQQAIKDIAIDVESGIVRVGVEIFKETQMPADATHVVPYNLISNRNTVYQNIKAADIQPEFDALVNKVDTLI